MSSNLTPSAKNLCNPRKLPGRSKRRQLAFPACAAASVFFGLTGLHGLHVFVGLVAMAMFLGRLLGPGGDPGERSVFQVVTYYWHFVDIVWIFLYSALFLLGG